MLWAQSTTQGYTRAKITTVGWCFEPSQPHRVIPGLKSPLLVGWCFEPSQPHRVMPGLKSPLLVGWCLKASQPHSITPGLKSPLLVGWCLEPVIPELKPQLYPTLNAERLHRPILPERFWAVCSQWWATRPGGSRKTQWDWRRRNDIMRQPSWLPEADTPSTAPRSWPPPSACWGAVEATCKKHRQVKNKKIKKSETRMTASILKQDPNT